MPHEYLKRRILLALVLLSLIGCDSSDRRAKREARLERQRAACIKEGFRAFPITAPYGSGISYYECVK